MSSMHVYRKAILRFGITEENPDGVTVPVGLSTAVREVQPMFTTLHEGCNAPIKQEKRCSKCDEIAHETVSGYEFVKGEYVVFTKEEIEAAKPTRSPYIEIKKFVPMSQMRALMLDRYTYLVPSALNEDGYGALYEALADAGRVGIGSHSMSGKEHPCALVIVEGVLGLVNLNLSESIVHPDFSPPLALAEAIQLTRTVVDGLSDDIQSSDLTSPYKDHMLSLVRAKQEGAETPTRPTEEARQPVDLIAALKATVAATEKKKPVRKTAAKKA